MSPTARRYFGCVLPLILLIFGCGTCLLVGYAGRVAIQVERVPDDTMAPLLQPGWTVIVNNMAFWVEDPARGDVVTVALPDGWVLRRIVGVPGDTIEIREGEVLIDGEDLDTGYDPHGQGPDHGPVDLGTAEYFVVGDDRTADDSRTWGPIQRDDIHGRAIFQLDPQRSVHPVLVTPTPPPESESGGSGS